MKTFLFLVVFISCGVNVFSDNIVWNENPLNVEYPFSDTYFKWIKDDIAIVLTRYNNLSTEAWRTIDSGQTWKSLKSQLQRSEIQSSQPGFLYPNPVDLSRFYIRGESNVSWISSDMGATWTAIFPLTSTGEFKRFANLEWHPTRSDWALASVGIGLILDVYYTNNFGKTWNFVSKTNRFYSWGDAGRGNVPAEAIYLNLPSADLYSGTFSVTTDFGTTFTTIQTNTMAIVFLEKQIFSLKQLPSSSYEAVLKVTPHIGSSYKIFYDATFPFGKDIDYNGYSLLDDHTGAVFMGINHNGLYDSWGNIYVSNSIGNQYALSSAHVSQMWPFYDFVRVQGIDGVYITNVVKDWTKNSPKKESLISSYITFDNGGSWQSLSPPHFDSNGNRIQCTGRCSLHLHGITSFFEPDPYGFVYTTPNSIGIIIATGNIGENLLWDMDSINTYLSRDGGLNWIELQKGNSIYEIGDHGAIIVFAPFGQSTNKIYYTLDEGLTVKSVTFNSPFIVDNIRVEPTATGEKFMVIGSRQGNGIVIGVDFSKIYNTTCLGSQYETWTPSNGKKDINGLSCLLGKDIVYRRRNRTALCFNQEQVDPVLSVAYCACTEDDWECDMGFERDANNNCVLSANANYPTYPPEVCPSGTTYNKTKGYRQVAGTSCRAEAGVSYWGDGPYDCPSDNPSGSKGWIAAVVLVILVIIIIVGTFVAMRSEWVRERVPFIKKLHGLKVGYFGMRSAPDTIGEELESQNDSEPFSIGGDEEETSVIKSTLPSAMPKFDDDTFNPRT